MPLVQPSSTLYIDFPFVFSANKCSAPNTYQLTTLTQRSSVGSLLSRAKQKHSSRTPAKVRSKIEQFQKSPFMWFICRHGFPIKNLRLKKARIKTMFNSLISIPIALTLTMCKSKDKKKNYKYCIDKSAVREHLCVADMLTSWWSVADDITGGWCNRSLKVASTYI